MNKRNNMIRLNFKKLTELSILALIASFISACQAPVVNPNSQAGQPSVTSRPTPTIPTTRPIPKTPLPKAVDLPKSSTGTHSESTQQTKPTIKPRPVTSQDVLAQQRAKQNAKQQSSNSLPSKKNGANIPAFNKLMKIGIRQLRANQLNSAQQTFTKAQRLGPQSPAVYMYLSEIAIKNRQGTQAENLARRGLLVSRSKRYDKALWQMVLISAKMRNRGATVEEAQRQLKKLQ